MSKEQWKAIEVGVSDMGPNGVPVYEIFTADDRVRVCEFMSKENAERIVRAVNTHDELLNIVHRLTLATNEGDDAAQGTHYVAKDGAIRCKGSFLSLIEDARAAIAKASS